MSRGFVDSLDSAHMVGEKRRILAGVIPEIPCPSDCSLCCEMGLSWVWSPDRFCVEDYVFSEDTSCDKLVNGRCSLYSKRILICRLFFKIKGLFPCPRGIEPEGGMMPRKMVEDILWCWLSDDATTNDAKAVRARWYERSQGCR